MNIKERLTYCREQGVATLATNFYNLETLQGILSAAKATGEPVILQLTQSSINYMGLDMAYKMARAGLAEYGVTGWIHLDHGGSYELARDCILKGFDSVMIDGSELPFEQNIEITNKVVRFARQYNVHVEAELGFVAKLGQNAEDKKYTQPEEAMQFVKETHVDALAVAIGSAHGFYKEKPELQFDLLKKIHHAVSTPLVLHGSSGIPHNDVQKAVSYGICKVNLATEIKDTFMRSLKNIMTSNQEIDLRKVFPEATKDVTHLVSEKLLMVKGK